MSSSVLCQGCGGRVDVPDDFDRARIRCPQCGVMGDVPARPAKKPAAAKTPSRAAEDDDAGALLLRDDPPPRPPRATADIQERRPKKAAPRLAVPPPAPFAYDHSDEDDGKPYFVPGLDDERPCPQCRGAIPREAVLCVHCGFDLRVGKKVVQEYQPVERDWTAGLPLAARLGIFLALEAVVLPLMLWGARAAELPLFGWFFPWLVFTGMTAFILGTFDRIHLSRNKKGRVRLTKRWFVCFLPRPPAEIDVHDYGGVAYGQVDETSAMEWITMFLLLGAGVVPGIIFFFLAIQRATSQVALTRDHGHSAFILYRGGNRDMMLDIAETVRNVAHLPPAG